MRIFKFRGLDFLSVVQGDIFKYLDDFFENIKKLSEYT